MSVEEYLSFEKTSDVRHEYVGGEIFALAGASLRHAEIVGNIYYRLRDAARERGCQVVTNDIKVQAAVDVIYYPDVVLTCDASDRGPYVLRSPMLVVEVLSPSTDAIDPREKMIHYRRIASLLCYLIVHQDEQRIEQHWRDGTDDVWEFSPHLEGVPTEIKIPGLGTELTFGEVYEGISFEVGN